MSSAGSDVRLPLHIVTSSEAAAHPSMATAQRVSNLPLPTSPSLSLSLPAPDTCKHATQAHNTGGALLQSDPPTPQQQSVSVFDPSTGKLHRNAGNGAVIPPSRPAEHGRFLRASRAVHGVTVHGLEDGCGRARHPSCSARHGS